MNFSRFDSSVCRSVNRAEESRLSAVSDLVFINKRIQTASLRIPTIGFQKFRATLYAAEKSLAISPDRPSCGFLEMKRVDRIAHLKKKLDVARFEWIEWQALVSELQQLVKESKERYRANPIDKYAFESYSSTFANYSDSIQFLGAVFEIYAQSLEDYLNKNQADAIGYRKIYRADIKLHVPCVKFFIKSNTEYQSIARSIKSVSFGSGLTGRSISGYTSNSKS